MGGLTTCVFWASQHMHSGAACHDFHNLVADGMPQVITKFVWILQFTYIDHPDKKPLYKYNYFYFLAYSRYMLISEFSRFW